jgi:hypothetical protein
LFWNGTAFNETVLVYVVDIYTHSVPAGFDFDVGFVEEELLTSFATREEGVDRSDRGVSINIAHCKGVIELMWMEII